MQMCVYAGWLTHAVNTTEFISLKPWASHSRRCDVTHKRFTNIVSEMVIPPPKAMLCCSSNSACCCISTCRRSSVAALNLQNFFFFFSQAHHTDTESNLLSDSKWPLSPRPGLFCELNCLAGGSGAICTCWYLWAPACSTGLPADPHADAGFMLSWWSILINSHLKQVEFGEVPSCRDSRSASLKHKHKQRDI